MTMLWHSDISLSSKKINVAKNRSWLSNVSDVPPHLSSGAV